MFPSRTIRGQEFRDERRDKKYSASKIRFLIDNTSEGGQTSIHLGWAPAISPLSSPKDPTQSSLPIPNGVNMRSLRTWMRTVVILSVVVSIAQAKTNYAYSANFNANTVSVINTSNNTVVATIFVGTRPWGAAVNQAGSVAY